jgi:hypothetical protein
MENAPLMEELERYECCGVPPHVWTAPRELAALVLPARSPARVLVADHDFLGIEAMPSPALDRPLLHA